MSISHYMTIRGTRVGLWSNIAFWQIPSPYKWGDVIYWRPHISTWALLHTYSCQLVEETPQFISLLLPFGKLLCLHSVNIFVFFHWNMYNDFSFFYFSGKRTNLKYFGQYSNILPSNNIQGILTMPHLHPTFW